MCDWGEPSLVYSDRGTQLVSAAGGLDPSDKEDTVDWGKVEQKTGVKWIFTPAKSQWGNGRAESLVKGKKHSLKTTFKHVDMEEISYMLSSRPIELLLGFTLKMEELKNSIPVFQIRGQP